MPNTELIDSDATLTNKLIKLSLLLFSTAGLSFCILVTIYDPAWLWLIIVALALIAIIDLLHLNALWLVINGYRFESYEKKLFWLFMVKAVIGASTVTSVWFVGWLIEQSYFIGVVFVLIGLIYSLYQYERGEI